MNSDDIFDAAEGNKARDEAIKRVAKNADKAWMLRCEAVLQEICLTTPEFTTDRIWWKMGDDRPHEPRALGAVTRRAAKNGIMHPKDCSPHKSIRKRCHRRPLTVWVSNIYKNGQP